MISFVTRFSKSNLNNLNNLYTKLLEVFKFWPPTYSKRVGKGNSPWWFIFIFFHLKSCFVIFLFYSFCCTWRGACRSSGCLGWGFSGIRYPPLSIVFASGVAWALPPPPTPENPGTNSEFRNCRSPCQLSSLQAWLGLCLHHILQKIVGKNSE